jgi:hypothetical protein
LILSQAALAFLRLMDSPNKRLNQLLRFYGLVIWEEEQRKSLIRRLALQDEKNFLCPRQLLEWEKELQKSVIIHSFLNG